MGKELFKNIPSKVGDLVKDVRNGRIGLPDLKIRQTDAAIAYILDQIPHFTGDILKQFFSHLEPPKSNAMVAAFSLYKPITNSVRYIGHF